MTAPAYIPGGPFERVVQALGHRVVRRTPRGVLAKCPAHDDHTPSLSVDRGADGRVLFRCRSHGCSAESIVAAIGLEMEDLFVSGNDLPPPPPAANRDKPRNRYPSADSVSAMYARLMHGGRMTNYDYLDAAGCHVGRVVRFDFDDGQKKQIRRARLDGDAWIAKDMLTPKPLYNLRAILATYLDDLIVVVEGEKCVDKLTQYGIAATTSAGGSNAPLGDTDWSPLAKRHVVMSPDNDEPGKKYLEGVVQQARTAGAKAVAVLHLDGLEEHEDVFDWIAKREALGQSSEAIAAELRQLMTSARPIDNDPKPQVEAEVIEPRPQRGVRWPAPLSDVVRIGVLGRFLGLVEAQTEADPAAIVIDFVVRFGNAVGRGPHFTVSGDRHGCNLFACLVGKTAQGRKGTSAAFPRRLLEMADADWAARCVKNGLSSGEGIIHAVRDPAPTGRHDKEGHPILDDGIADKRLMVHESELARTLRAASRRDNTLMPILRQAWESGRLATMTKQPYSATDAHVSLVAHVTSAEFMSLLADDDVHGGTINRFLFFASKRCRELPFGGDVPEVELARVGAEVQRCLSAARGRGRMEFSQLAREIWPSVYTRLLADEKAPGIVGALLGRAVAQVRRLAMIFALVDSSAEVDVQHLDAALEVWRYSKETVHHVFGTSTGNRIADRILGELRGTPEGVNRTGMHKLFGRHVSAQEIDEALILLHSLGLVECRKSPTNGRPAETWFAIEQK